MAVNFRAKKHIGPRINEQITASEVRVISSTGKQLGIISIREALNHAEDEGFDLVEVSPEASPPVCKIIDYGKLKYREQKSCQQFSACKRRLFFSCSIWFFPKWNPFYPSY